MLLKTNDAKGTCFIETKNLDGETNLKHKSANKDIMFDFRDDKMVRKTKNKQNFLKIVLF